MDSDYYQPVEVARPRRRSFLAVLLLALLLFLGGAVTMTWLLARWTSAASFIGIGAAPQDSFPISPPVQIVRETTPSASGEGAPPQLVIDPEMGRRVMRLEQRLAELDAQARTAAGNAHRAEGLLVAFAARRALDRGVGLGYLEGLLQQRFGETQPQAVGIIISAARRPVTLQELQEELQQTAPSLAGGGPDQSWWDAFRGQMRNLITIRKSGTPSPMPAERLGRAVQRLESGQVEVALAEVLRLPGREAAAVWIGDARHYVRARRALDTIETAALLEPRMQVNVRPVAPVQVRAARPGG